MMTTEEFIKEVLDADDARPPQAPMTSALPDGHEGFDTHAPDAAQPTSKRSRRIDSARRLLEKSGFGLPENIQKASVIRPSDPAARYLPDRVAYWPKTPMRPYQTLLFEADLTRDALLGISPFKATPVQHLDDVEAALARFVSAALHGFERGGEGVTADVRKGRKEETLCVVSIVDSHDDDPVRLVCFGTWNAETDGLETFQISEQARHWDRQLAEEHLTLLYERQFKKLAGPDWQQAFTTTEERKQARRLLEVCTNPARSHDEILHAARLLLDTIAASFGLKRKLGAKWILDGAKLPVDHDIGTDPRQPNARNAFGGMALHDEKRRLLGYLVYPLDNKADALRLRGYLEQHNRFHNVLVIYPSGTQTNVELWQGDRPLVGKLRKDEGYQGEADVVNLLSRFFVVSKAKIKTPTQLAQELAYRARYLHRLARRQLSDEPQSGSLRSLFAAFSEMLLHGQTEDAFADVYAQTLTYGLLAARWLSKDDQRTRGLRFTRLLAAEHLPVTSPFLRDLFHNVLQAGFEVKLTWLLDDIASLLDRIDVDLVFSATRDLFHSLSTDPIIHFYEPFLAEYDADQRKERGVYYTPDAIVRYIVASVDRRLRQILPPIGSLSSGSVRIVDPATGTGTFLCEVIRYSHEQGATPERLDRVFGSLRGLEIMAAPYAICHLRLALMMKALLARGESARAIRVHLGDTLDPAVEPPPLLFRDSPALAREAIAAKHIKEEAAWTVVIGNPPYKNNSTYTLAQIAERFPTLLASSRAAAAAKKRNIRDDYAWFFAAADSLTTSGGIICFVTSDSYLKKASYVHFRKELLKHYKVDGITRLGAGIFKNVGPRIGFAIIMLERRQAPLSSPDQAEGFDLVDISELGTGLAARLLGTPQDPRLLWLAQSADLPNGTPVQVPVVRVKAEAINDYRFLAGTADATSEVNLQIVAEKKTRYKSLFIKKWPGIITAFDRLLKAESHATLAARMRSFFRIAERCDSSEIEGFALEFGCSEDDLERLKFLCARAQQDRLKYSNNKLKPVFAGSIPDGNEWYPPIKYSQWLYYEPQIQIPRNINPGKSAGWGWMQQWREPATHEQFPKLIFTTSTNVRYGFRAYVISSGWYTKLDGAASQKYHYVTLNDPTKTRLLDGEHNNLTSEGALSLNAVRASGLEDEDLFHIIAAIYNSRYGRGYVEQEADSMLPLPCFHKAGGTALSTLAIAAKRLRTLHGMRQPESKEPFPEPPSRVHDGGDISQAIQENQALIDDIVDTLVDQ